MQQVPVNSTPPDKVTIINPDGSVSYEPNLYYQQPTIIRRTYRKPVKPKYRYMIEQVFLLLIDLSEREREREISKIKL